MRPDPAAKQGLGQAPSFRSQGTGAVEEDRHGFQVILGGAPEGLAQLAQGIDLRLRGYPTGYGDLAAPEFRHAHPVAGLGHGRILGDEHGDPVGLGKGAVQELERVVTRGGDLLGLDAEGRDGDGEYRTTARAVFLDGDLGVRHVSRELFGGEDVLALRALALRGTDDGQADAAGGRQ